MRALPSASARASGAARWALATHLWGIKCMVRSEECTATRRCVPGSWRSSRKAAARCTTHCMCFASVACVTHRRRRRPSLLHACHQRTVRRPLVAMCPCRDIAHGGQLHRAQKTPHKKVLNSTVTPSKCENGWWILQQSEARCPMALR